MTAGQPAREPTAYPGLLAALMAAVRPEFRGDTLGFDPRDPVFGGPPCLVEGCERAGRNRGLCRWHYQQWCEKKPDFAGFVAGADPQWRPRAVPRACQVPGCEYGGIDSDYVFINIWAQPRGQAWSYPAAYDLVMRLRAKTGLDFDPHWFRHSAATRWLRDGIPVEVVSKLLGHSSVTVTSAVYGHLTAADARAALEKAGWLTGNEVSW